MDTATLRDLTQTTLRLQRIRPQKNERRFYTVTITSDLFGQVVLLRNWGRVSTGGRLRWDLYPDISTAEASLRDLARRKRQRGYQEL